MPRNMSFFLTTDQIRNRTKTVTRRLGWKNLKPGEKFNGCEKCQGLKKGEKVNKLELLRCLSNTPEPIAAILLYDQIEVAREGFPDMNQLEFLRMFCKHMRCEQDEEVRRIKFEYVN